MILRRRSATHISVKSSNAYFATENKERTSECLKAQVFPYIDGVVFYNRSE